MRTWPKAARRSSRRGPIGLALATLIAVACASGPVASPAATPVAGATVGDGFSIVVPLGFVGSDDNGVVLDSWAGEILTWFWHDPRIYPPRYVGLQPIDSPVGPAASLAAKAVLGQSSPNPLPPGTDLRATALPAGNAVSFVRQRYEHDRLRTWYFDGPDGMVWVLTAQNLSPAEEEAFVLSLRWGPLPSATP